MMGATTIFRYIRMMKMPTKEGLRKDFEALALRCARKKARGTADRDDEAILWAARILAALGPSQPPPLPDNHP